MVRRTWIAVALSWAMVMPIHGSTFSSDFAMGLPGGAEVYGNAAATGGSMQIVPSANSQTGTFVVSNLTGNSNVTVFDVSCQVFTGNPGNPASPADGWSFAWGNVPSTAWGEEGPDSFSGLVVSFDYFINSGAGESAREVTVNWNGARIGSVAYDSYSAGNTVPVHIRLRHGGLLDVWHNGNLLFKGLSLPGFNGLTSPRWGFGARTGAARAEVRVDDLVITPDPILVTNPLNTGAGSLRQAIAAALSAPGPNQVHFHPDLSDSYVYLDGSLEIGGQTLAIDASMLPSAVILQASSNGRVIDAGDSTSNLSLNRLMLRAGLAHATDPHGALGGGIYSTGIVDAEDCTFFLCEAATGGAVYGNGAKSMSFNRCTFRVNGAATGGGIASAGSPVVINRCTFHGNFATAGDGGAIDLASGSCSITHSTFNANQSSAHGGAITCGSSASISLTNSILQGNTASISHPDLQLNGASASLAGVNIIGITDTTGPASMQAGSPNAAGHFVGSPTAPVDAGLQYFGDHGGHTFTLLLDNNSLARDRATVTGSTSDQRLLPVFGTPDIGALEAQIAPVSAQTMLENHYVEIPILTGSIGELVATSGNISIIENSSMLTTGSSGGLQLYIQGEPDANGQVIITLTDSGTGEFVTFQLTVEPVNSMPQFTLMGTQNTYYGNSEAVSVAGFATVTSKGAPDESGQQVHFSVTTPNPEFFTSLPAINNNGTLTYQMSAMAFGSATVIVRAIDNGGTANGGVDTSDSVQFSIQTQAAFTSDFSSLPSGASLHGNGVLSNGKVRLVDTDTDQQGSVILDNFTGQRSVTTFDVTFDLTTGNNPFSIRSPADGYAFAWGDLPSTSFGEEGPQNFDGLVVSFDYFKGAGSEQHVSINWSGAEIGRISYNAYTDSTVPVHIRLRAGGLLDVWHAGNRLFSGVQLPGFSGLTAPRWGFGGRTGGNFSTVLLDNLVISPKAFTVTSGNESGSGTLRNAVENTGSALAPGPNQIQFTSIFSGAAINLGSEIEVHLQNVLIDGASLSNGVTLRVPSTSAHFGISSYGQLMLSRIALTRIVSNAGNTNAAIQSSGILELWDCTIHGCVSSRVGGALIAYAGSIHADGCTFSQNTASDGGALWIQGSSTTASLNRCTIVGNSAALAFGGGLVFLGDSLRISHCTITGNAAASTAAGMFIQSPSKLDLSNTIIAGNTALSQRDLYSYNTTLNVSGHNLIGAAGSAILNDFPAGLPNLNGDFVGTESDPLDAKLGIPGSHGGYTATVPLLTVSPAVDRALDSLDSKDQRGFAIIGSPDIGAYESGNTPNYDRWAAEQSANPLAGDVDEDQDGQSNFMEYAFLSDPLKGNGDPVTFSGGLIEFPFRRATTDLLYEIQESEDLVQWIAIGEVRTSESGVQLIEYGETMIDPTEETIRVTPAESSEERTFWRVVAERK